MGYIAAHFPIREKFTDHLEETPVPAWRFQIDDVTVIAEQVADSMDLSAPAETWLILGRGIVLPGGVPFPRTWAEFRANYRGEVILTTDELGAHVKACDMPGLVLYLTFDYASMNPDSLTADHIPGGALMEEIGVYPTDTTWSCE